MGFGHIKKWLNKIASYRTIAWAEFYPVPNNKILDLTKFKEFADDTSNMAQMIEFVYDWVKKHMFSKVYCVRVIKAWERD